MWFIRSVELYYFAVSDIDSRVTEAVRQLSGHAVVNSTVMRLLRDRQAQVYDVMVVDCEW